MKTIINSLEDEWMRIDSHSDKTTREINLEGGLCGTNCATTPRMINTRSKERELLLRSVSLSRQPTRDLQTKEHSHTSVTDRENLRINIPTKEEGVSKLTAS